MYDIARTTAPRSHLFFLHCAGLPPEDSPSSAARSCAAPTSSPSHPQLTDLPSTHRKRRAACNVAGTTSAPSPTYQDVDTLASGTRSSAAQRHRILPSSMILRHFSLGPRAPSQYMVSARCTQESNTMVRLLQKKWNKNQIVVVSMQVPAFDCLHSRDARWIGYQARITYRSHANQEFG